ncbi:glycosyltransferase family 39 protein [Candidatus Nitrospira salsa]
MLKKDDIEKGKDIYAFPVSSVLLISVTVIAAALRIYRLGYQSLWMDEVLTYLSSNGTLAHVLFQTEVHTSILPLYYLFVHAFLYLGEEDIILRVPSLIFGTLSIPLFFMVVRDMLGSLTGTIASFLLAISPFHIFYSQEARPYALYLFLCLLALYLLQQCLNRENNHWLKLGFIVAAASTFYCHTTAVPFLVFLGLYIMITLPKQKWREWIPTFLGLGILLLPALYRIYTIQVGWESARSFEAPYLLYILWAFSTGFSLGPNLIELHQPDKMKYIVQYLPIIVPIFMYVVTIFAFGVWKLFRKDKAILLILALLFLLPVIFVGLAAILNVGPFNTRYIIPSLLPFLVFVALGVQNFQKRSFQIVSVCIFTIISIVSLNNYYFEDHYHREDSRGASQFLAEHAIQGDLIICMAPYTKTTLLHYLSSANNFSVVGYPKDNAFVDPVQIPEDLQKIIAGRNRFWVFFSRIFHADPTGHLKSHLESFFSPTSKFNSTGVELILYEIPKMVYLSERQ